MEKLPLPLGVNVYRNVLCVVLYIYIYIYVFKCFFVVDYMDYSTQTRILVKCVIEIDCQYLSPLSRFVLLEEELVKICPCQ